MHRKMKKEGGKYKIVVLCPHPDDAVVGAGGLINRLVANKNIFLTKLFGQDYHSSYGGCYPNKTADV